VIKPTPDVMDAVRLYEAINNVIVLCSIFDDEVLLSVRDWLQYSGAELSELNAVYALIDANLEEVRT
jgi:hypothetical protein